MATNIIRMDTSQTYQQSFTVTDPTSPNSGDAVLVAGLITGIALTDEGEGQNDSDKTSVHIGAFVADLPVEAVNNAGASPVGVGDNIYYDSAATIKLNKDNTNGVFFGFALATIASGQNATIPVLHTPPGE